MSERMRLTVILALAGLVSVASLLVIPLLVMGGMMWGAGMMSGGMMGGMGLALLFLLLVLVGMALLAVWTVRRFSSGSVRQRDEAIGLLRARYARGEIGREEFERIRADLAGRADTGEELLR